MSISKIKTADNKVHNIVPYYAICETKADEAIKELTIADFQLEAGTSLVISFKYPNSAADPKIEVNKDGVQTPIHYHGEPPQAIIESWSASSVVSFIYDGEAKAWNLIGSVSGAEDDANSKIKVVRTNKSDDKSYPILIGSTSIDNIGTPGKENTSSSMDAMLFEDGAGEPTIYANPKSGTIYANSFKGGIDISGSESITGIIPLINGGTNASNAEEARKNLGFTYSSNPPNVTDVPGTGNGAIHFFTDDVDSLESGLINGGSTFTTPEEIGIKDYVVEEYLESGKWCWRKWKSGRAECWTEIPQTSLRESTAVNEIVKDKLYYARTKPINLPINFTTLHHFSANAHIKGSTYGAAFVAPYIQENRTDQVIIDVLGSKSTGDIEYTMYVYGSM